jgi:hypothetical protein
MTEYTYNVIADRDEEKINAGDVLGQLTVSDWVEDIPPLNNFIIARAHAYAHIPHHYELVSMTEVSSDAGA